MLCKVSIYPLQWRPLQKLHVTKYSGCGFANRDIVGLQSSQTLPNSNNSYNFDSALNATLAWQAQLYVNMDFSKQCGVNSDCRSRLKLETHWMHWCEWHYMIFRWKIWIGLECLTLGNRPETRGLCLWSWMMIKCIMSGNLNNFSASCYCMYFFNIVRHHIIFIFNTKRPISGFFFLVKCCKESLKAWV